jgi:hypothetical protein
MAFVERTALFWWHKGTFINVAEIISTLLFPQALHVAGGISWIKNS